MTDSTIPAGDLPGEDSNSADQAVTADEQLDDAGEELDDPEATAGYRSVVDEDEDLDPGDPNSASADGDNDHEDFIGEESDEDLGVDAAAADLQPVDGE